MSVPPDRSIRFGNFELDVRAGELRKHGIRVRLQEQSFQILLMLLDRPGEVVLREEIQRKLWPNNTIVEFDHSINAAIKRLRNALGESAEKPGFIETLAKRGYRFSGQATAEAKEPLRPGIEPLPVALEGGPDDFSGRTFSHFRLLDKLGSGGMGVVYRAEDLKLGRQVALKFLLWSPEELPASFLERFEREARAASALNHPNMCTVYSVENFAGHPAIVMELVEGETLEARLRRGALKLDHAVSLAIQIASAMAEAHGKGVVHRDLKPANIMLTKSGVKVLDFGLAKIKRQILGVSQDPSMTAKGTILGTVQYMSPEQAQGKETDARGDIFSFGLVFYEMIAGKPAFEGANPASMLAAILEREAPTIQPAALNRVMQACLAKDPADRFQTARDLQRAIEWSGRAEVDAPAAGKHDRRPWQPASVPLKRTWLRMTDPYRELRGQQEHLSDLLTSTVAQSAAEAPKEWRRRFPRWGLEVAAVLAAALVGAAFWAASGSRGVGKYRFAPIEVTWANPSPAIWSSDGKAFAYTAEADGVQQLFLRYLNSPTPVQLTHDANALDLLGWSPDNKRLVVEGKNPNGGAPLRALFSVPVVGGDPEFMTLRDSETSASGISPDGKVEARLRYSRETKKFELFVASPVGSPLRKYSPEMAFDSLMNRPQISFAPDSRRIYLMVDPLAGRQLWSVPYPPGSGTPRQSLKGAFPPSGTTPEFSPFPDGRHAVVGLQATHEEEFEHLWMMDLRSGARQPITTGMASEGAPSVSPDGKRILLLETRGEFTLASVSLADASVKKVISSELPNGMPAWAMHQEIFAYMTNRNGPAEIWVRGEGWDRPIVTTDAFPAGTASWFMNPALSPGADRVIYTAFYSGENPLAWISSLSGGSPVRLTNSTGVVEWGGSWSPDGGHFVYLQVGNNEISLMIVKPAGDTTPTLLRAKVRYQLPEWSPDGQWIAFDAGGTLGSSIISPDGQTVRSYGSMSTSHMTFSKDSRLLYGIRSDHDHRYLFSLNLATKETKNVGDVGKDYTPASYLEPGIRFSLSPDGKSILYPTMKWTSSLWMLEGFDPPRWWGGLGGMF